MSWVTRATGSLEERKGIPRHKVADDSRNNWWLNTFSKFVRNIRFSTQVFQSFIKRIFHHATHPLKDLPSDFLRLLQWETWRKIGGCLWLSTGSLQGTLNIFQPTNNQCLLSPGESETSHSLQQREAFQWKDLYLPLHGDHQHPTEDFEQRGLSFWIT